MIEFSDVCLTYNGASRPALDGVSLTITNGEAVAVVGPSGSGKTSFLRLLNALNLPTSGRVTIDGLDTNDPANLWEIRRRVGLIFQNPDNQLVSTTVERELAFGMENLGLQSTEIAARIEDVLDLLDLRCLRHRAPHRLSGGEKQRVAIAAVLAMRPVHLALDEPTSLLDGEGRREVWEILSGLSGDASRTVVHVTQFPDEIGLSRRAIVIDAGRVVFDGPPMELFAEEDRLRAWGLEPPSAMRLAARLRRDGLEVPDGATTLD